MSEQPEKEFPICSLPRWLKTVVECYNEERNFPIPYVAASMLFATSVAIGSSVKLIFPKFDGIYANIFLAIVGSRGNNKSAPLQEIMRPLQEINNNYCKEYEKERKLYEALPPEQRDKTHRPVAKRLTVSDITSEKLCLILNENKHGVGLITDELKSWFGSFDRYRKQSSGVDESFFLSLYNCSSIIKDRTNSSSIICVENPYVSIAGTIQTSVFNDAMTRNRIDNGLFDRILISAVEEDGFIPWSNDNQEEPLRAGASWNRIINNIYSLSLEYEKSGQTMAMRCKDDKTIQWIMDWRNEHEEENLSSATDDVKALFRKTQVYCLKIMMIISLLHYGCSNEDPLIIDFEKAVAATTITDWFYEKSKALLLTKQHSKYTEQQADFVRKLPERFTTAEALVIGAETGICERSIKAFLKEQKGILFIQPSRGNYYKK